MTLSQDQLERFYYLEERGANSPQRSPQLFAGQWVPILATNCTVIDRGDLVANRSVGDVLDLEIDGSFVSSEIGDLPTRVVAPMEVMGGVDYQQFVADRSRSPYNAGAGTDLFRVFVEVTTELITDTVVPSNAGAYAAGAAIRPNLTGDVGSGWEWNGAGAANRRSFQNTGGTIDYSAYGLGITRHLCGIGHRYSLSTLGYDASGTRVWSDYRFGSPVPWELEQDVLGLWLGSNGTAERAQMRCWYRGIVIWDPSGQEFSG